MYRILSIIAIITSLFSVNVLAGNQIFSSTLNSGAPTTLGGATHCVADDLAYNLVGPFQVSVTGDYDYYDVGYALAEEPYIDITIGLYNGVFNPASPLTNQIGISDDNDGFALTSGQDYYIVVQAQGCSGNLGDWMYALTGTGSITGTITNELISRFFFDEIDGSGPKINAVDCGSDTAPYTISGPFSVPVTGEYLYGDVMYYSGSGDSTNSALYEGSFDANNPLDNRLGIFNYDGAINLTSGTSYILVTQPYCSNGNFDNVDGTMPFIVGFAAVGLVLPAVIPTMSVWGLGILAGLLGLMGFVRRRKL